MRWALLSFHRATELLPHTIKQRRTQIALDSCVAAVAVLLAYALRFDFSVSASFARQMWRWSVAMAILRPASLIVFAGYKSIWRFLRVQDVAHLLLASLPPSLLLLSVRLAAHQSFWIAQVPRGVIVLEFAMFVGIAAGARGLRRAVYEEAKVFARNRKRALLLGTEETLAAALGQVRAFPELDVVGHIAPGQHLRGFQIGRVPVVGEPIELASVLLQNQIEVMLITDTSLDWVAEARSTATRFGIDIRSLPSAANVMRGEVRVSRSVDQAKVFGEGRSSPKSPHAVLEAYRDRVVLVTGAGGSIGSELSRQIVELGAGRLLLLDNDENSIFEIHNELDTQGAEVVPIVGDIRDERLLKHVFAKYSPHTVLHSAAYKHVPVMESNPSQAVLNNVIGTRNLLDGALECRSELFIMISSDKAVRPASVMGASKRLAEMLIQKRAASSPGTRLACVRFGNVIGSRGSVVPIFLKQIAEGKPVTITDERMSRYFMTIQEAVQLVLQASTLARNGEIYILDTGEPVKITTLARRLIEMSGLRPEKDVPMEIVGTRAGEKLEEMLWEDEAVITATEFAGLYSFQAEDVPVDIEVRLSQLEQVALDRRDAEVLSRLRSMQIGYGEQYGRLASKQVP
jgi:FlaA1/EpsC-like NDP-sugar epimerase